MAGRGGLLHSGWSPPFRSRSGRRARLVTVSAPVLRSRHDDPGFGTRQDGRIVQPVALAVVPVEGGRWSVAVWIVAVVRIDPVDPRPQLAMMRVAMAIPVSIVTSTAMHLGVM